MSEVLENQQGVAENAERQTENKGQEGQGLLGGNTEPVAETVDYQLPENTFTLPGEDADPSEWNLIYDKLGRPESPAEYKYEHPENIPDEIRYQGDDIAEFSKKAHELGLSQKQFEGALAFLSERNQAKFEELSASSDSKIQAMQDQVRKEHGDKFSDVLKNANRALQHFATAEQQEAIKSDPMLSNHPVLINMLNRISQAMNPDSALGVSPGAALPRFESVETLQQQLKALKEEIYSQPGSQRWNDFEFNPDSPDYKRRIDLLQRIKELRKK